MPELIRRNILQVKSPTVNFNDRLLELNQNTVSYEQGVSFNLVAALSGALDSSIKNYSSVYLTDNKLDTDIFNITDKRFVTPAIFTQITHKCFDSGSSKDYYLFFVPNNDTKIYKFYNGIYYKVTDGDPPVTVAVPEPVEKLAVFGRYMDITSRNISNTFFEIELLPYSICRIKHAFNGSNYFLTYDSAINNKYAYYNTVPGGESPALDSLSALHFYFKQDDSSESKYDVIAEAIIANGEISSESGDPTLFKYILNNNTIYLYKMNEYDDSNPSYSPYGPVNSSKGGIVTLKSRNSYIDNRLFLSDMTFTPVVTALSGSKTVSSVNYILSNAIFAFGITDSRIDPILKINTSFVSYDIKQSTNGVIDENRSKFDIPSHSLLHFEYNNSIYPSIDVNILKLKTNLSDKNFTKYQSYLYNNDLPVTLSDKPGTEGHTADPQVIGVNLLFTQVDGTSGNDGTNVGSVAIEIQPTGVPPQTYIAVDSNL